MFWPVLDCVCFHVICFFIRLRWDLCEWVGSMDNKQQPERKQAAIYQNREKTHSCNYCYTLFFKLMCVFFPQLWTLNCSSELWFSPLVTSHVKDLSLLHHTLLGLLDLPFPPLRVEIKERKQIKQADIHSVWSKNGARCQWTDECQWTAQSAACDLFRLSVCKYHSACMLHCVH